MFSLGELVECHRVAEMTDDSQAEGRTVDGLFPIRTVSQITGVNAITLRAWERRYGLIKPVRTAKGHRLFTQQDIDFIQRVVELTEKGVSIGQVRATLMGETPAQGQDVELDSWAVYRRRMLNAVVRFDVHALESSYNEALALYPVETVTKRLILPLLRALGERWQATEGSVAEEHFFGAYLRNKLGARFHHHPPTHGPKLLVACLPGERHEVGLMLFSLSALARGFQVVFLGADMPLSELAATGLRASANGILLSGAVEPPVGVMTNELAKLVASANVPVFVGGQVSVRLSDDIVRAGAIPLGADIASGLARIESQLGLAWAR